MDECNFIQPVIDKSDYLLDLTNSRVVKTAASLDVAESQMQSMAAAPFNKTALISFAS